VKYSELKDIVIEARGLGLEKLPGEEMWLKEYRFYEVVASFYISNIELISSNVPLATMLNMKYNEFWEKYQEKYGTRTWNTKSLSIKLGRY
jgi:hypothetical protein